jgi:hypothetical protein
MTTKHTHTVVFGRKVDGCPRCEELKNGAAPVVWASTVRKQNERLFIEAVRNHNCIASRCGPVCTFGDW